MSPEENGKLPAPGGSEILIYQSEDGRSRIQVRLAGETVWLTQRLMAELFQVAVPTVNEHIRNIYEEGELDRAATIRKFRIVQPEGGREVHREVEHYNLDVIISVGYRVKSHRGTQFRIWATGRLREYLVKGFALDDERLKKAGGGNYFEELLARIRDIRSSEKVFWRKVLDIYATSIDYDPSVEASRQFFAVVQNKMHWAAHGHTAAEIVASRADATQPHMGLTSWPGQRLGKADAGVAKNYLDQKELEALNRIVSFYLDFAELQAMGRRPMYMRDWISKLDDFLRLSERELLTHAGTVSHEDALSKAEAEYEKFHAMELSTASPAELDFQKAIDEVKRLERSKSDAQGKPKRSRKPKRSKKPPGEEPRERRRSS
jgi:hypothetical protein